MPARFYSLNDERELPILADDRPSSIEDIRQHHRFAIETEQPWPLRLHLPSALGQYPDDIGDSDRLDVLAASKAVHGDGAFGRA